MWVSLWYGRYDPTTDHFRGQLMLITEADKKYADPNAKFTTIEGLSKFEKTDRISIDIFMAEINGTITLLPTDPTIILFNEIVENGSTEQRTRLVDAINCGQIIIVNHLDGHLIVVNNQDSGQKSENLGYDQHFILQIAFPEPYLKFLGHKFKSVDDYNEIEKFRMMRLNTDFDSLDLGPIQKDLKQEKPADTPILYKKPGRPKTVDPTNAYAKKISWARYMQLCAERKLALEQVKNWKLDQRKKINSEYLELFDELKKNKKQKLEKINSICLERQNDLDHQVSEALEAHNGRYRLPL